MKKTQPSPVIHIILQERKGIDCVGKQFWEVEGRGGKESGQFFMLCMTHRTTACRGTEEGRENRSFNSVWSDFCPVVGLPTGVSWREKRKRVRQNKWWAKRDTEEEVREGEQV